MALQNPAVTALALANPDTVKKATHTALVLGVVVIASVGGLFYYNYFYKNRFKKISYDPKAPLSNISSDVARIKADTIYKAMLGIGNGFSMVKMTLSGVNRNGFIAIYNAFGKRKPADKLSLWGNSSHIDLIAWFNNQFSKNELRELRFLVSAEGYF